MAPVEEGNASSSNAGVDPQLPQLRPPHGADLNFPDSEGYEAMYISAREGHAKVVELLLDRIAEAVTEDQWGSTMNVLPHTSLTERMKIMPSMPYYADNFLR
ncbi:hypothetical protein ACQJBY_043803 [Aegilops geniculata]